MEPTNPMTQKASSSSDPAASTPKQKRKPVRRDPEKRRLQNIQAQKKYREKLKRRLGDLEVLAARVAQGPSAPAVDTPPTSSEASSSSPQDVDQQPTSYPDVALQRLPSPTLTRCKARVAAWPYDVSLVPGETFEEPDLFALWDTTTIVDPSHLIANSTKDSNEPPWEAQHSVTSYVDCNCPVRHVGLKGYPNGNDSLVFLDVAQNADFTRLDPYADKILFNKECIIIAMWSNCLQIGISDAAFCEDDAQSPFYRDGSNTYALSFANPNFNSNKPKGSAAAVNDNMVRTVQQIFKTLKPDLRPTKEQITVPHHPFLDIFPFPTFRRNVLTSDTLIDEDEFCNDIIRGLICWGSGGIGRRDRITNAAGSISSGTPWDSRSWEAEPWFLRKYWKLLGEEESELVRQSEWWRGVRGEDEDLWPLKLVSECC